MRRLMLGLGVFAALGYATFKFGRSTEELAHRRMGLQVAPEAPRLTGATPMEHGPHHLRDVPKKDSQRVPAGYTSRLPKSTKVAVTSVPSDTEAHHRAVKQAPASQRDQLAALGLRSADRSFQSKAGTKVLKQGRAGRAKALPKRWVRRLSGPNAHVAVYEKVQNNACSAHNTSNCDRRNSHDATITGVIVSTDKLASDPSETFEGDIKAGHFAEATPAVYVK